MSIVLQAVKQYYICSNIFDPKPEDQVRAPPDMVHVRWRKFTIIYHMHARAPTNKNSNSKAIKITGYFY